MPEFGPTQITALVLAVALIAVGLSYGKGPWRERRPDGAEAEVTPEEHGQFMRPGSGGSGAKEEDAG